MKKIISMAVICCMLTLTAIPSYAQSINVPPNNSGNNRAPTITEMISAYKEMGFKIRINEQDKNHAKYELVLDVEDEHTEAIVQASIDENGTQVLVCFENGKINVVELYINGDVFIDGEKVSVRTDATIVSVDNFSTISENPTRAHSNKWQESCPYGSASDYSKLYSSTSKVLTFEQAVKDFTISALCGVIAGLLFSSIIASAIAAAAVGTLITYFKNNNPTARAMSCTDNAYVHKTDGAYINSNKAYVYKHVVDFFAAVNYTIKVSTSTSYNIITT